MEEDGPRPGGRRYGGPRPAARGRDLGWATLAVVVTVVTASQFARLAVVLLDLDQRTGTGSLVLGFLVTVVWLLTIW